MTSPRKVGARQKKNKDQFSIKTSGIEILLNKGTQQDKHLVNCSSPFKYTCYVKVQILTVKFGKSVIFLGESFSDFLYVIQKWSQYLTSQIITNTETRDRILKILR